MFLQVQELKISPYVLPGLIDSDDNNSYKAEEIIECVCQYFQMPKIKAKKKSRSCDVVRVRNWCIFFIRFKTSLTLKQIANLFYVGCDHTTVMHARNTVTIQLNAKHDNEYKTDYTKLTERLLKLGII